MIRHRHPIRSRADLDKACLAIYGGPLGIKDPIRARIAYIQHQERKGVDMGAALETAYLDAINDLWINDRIGDDEHERRIEATLQGVRLEYLLMPQWPSEDDFTASSGRGSLYGYPPPVPHAYESLPLEQQSE